MEFEAVLLTSMVCKGVICKGVDPTTMKRRKQGTNDSRVFKLIGAILSPRLPVNGLLLLKMLDSLEEEIQR